MATQTALVAAGTGQYRLDTSFPVPKPGPGLLLCRVKAVGLNPADWKMVDFSPNPGSIGGNELAGEVIELGEGVTKFRKGDRILAVMFGLNPVDLTTGAFCQYGLATADLACRIPEHMSYEEAAALGVGISTATLVLYQMLKLPIPSFPSPAPPSGSGKGTYVLVSGGATATGTIAIQFLRASGLLPIATCSPSSREMVLSLGAVETFDYHSPTCGMEIRNFTGNSLAHVVDCVTQAESMKLCYEAVGPAGGRYIALDPFPTRIQYTRREIEADWPVGYTLFGNPVKLSGAYGRRATPEDREFGKGMFVLAEEMLREGMLKPHPIEVREGGLEGVVKGIEDLRKGRVRAVKLVYPVA